MTQNHKVTPNHKVYGSVQCNTATDFPIFDGLKAKTSTDCDRTSLFCFLDFAGGSRHYKRG